jgi:phage terminase large subunit-like protein
MIHVYAAFKNTGIWCVPNSNKHTMHINVFSATMVCLQREMWQTIFIVKPLLRQAQVVWRHLMLKDF